MKQGHVVVLGSVNVDAVLRCMALPVPGQTVKGGDFPRLTGGKGANQVVGRRGWVLRYASLALWARTSAASCQSRAGARERAR